MNESLRENILFASDKKAAARKLLDIMYSEAALDYSDTVSRNADCEEILEVFSGLFKGDKECETVEFAHFCREAAKSIKPYFYDEDRIDDVSHINALPPRVAYLRNGFSDKAYSKFSESFGVLTAVYFSGFSEPCEEVYYERCTHALLPIYNSRDGMVMSLYKLLLKYDLKIVSACDIEMNDESVMRYVLAAKNLPHDTEKSFADVSIVVDENCSLGAILYSLEILGAEIIMMNSYPLEYTNDGHGLILQLDMTSSDIEVLRVFLEGSRIRHDIIGCYNLTNN